MSLAKYEVFGSVAQTPEDMMLVGYKWALICKCNEKNEIIRIKNNFLHKISRRNLAFIMKKDIPV